MNYHDRQCKPFQTSDSTKFPLPRAIQSVQSVHLDFSDRRAIKPPVPGRCKFGNQTSHTSAGQITTFKPPPLTRRGLTFQIAQTPTLSPGCNSTKQTSKPPNLETSKQLSAMSWQKSRALAKGLARAEVRRCLLVYSCFRARPRAAMLRRRGQAQVRRIEKLAALQTPIGPWPIYRILISHNTPKV